jgi:hypothetical protein
LLFTLQFFRFSIVDTPVETVSVRPFPGGDSQLERLFYGKAVGGKGGKEFSHAYVVSMIFGLYTVKRDLVTGLLHFIFHLFFVLLFIFPNAGIIRAAFAIRIYAMFHDGF